MSKKHVSKSLAIPDFDTISKDSGETLLFGFFFDVISRIRPSRTTTDQFHHQAKNIWWTYYLVLSKYSKTKWIVITETLRSCFSQRRHPLKQIHCIPVPEVLKCLIEYLADKIPEQKNKFGVQTEVNMQNTYIHMPLF